MKIRRFYAKDMSQALKQISHELGGDAAILSTKKNADGIEVVAAVDYDEQILHKTDPSQIERGLESTANAKGHSNRLDYESKTAADLTLQQRQKREQRRQAVQQQAANLHAQGQQKYSNHQQYFEDKAGTQQQDNYGLDDLVDGRSLPEDKTPWQSQPKNGGGAGLKSQKIKGSKIAAEIQRELDNNKRKAQQSKSTASQANSYRSSGDSYQQISEDEFANQAAELEALFETRINERLDESDSESSSSTNAKKHPSNNEVEWGQDPNLSNLKDEVALLRNMLQSQMEGLAWKNQSLRSPVQSAIMEKLLQLGFVPALSKQLGQGVASTNSMATAWQQTINSIESSIATPEYEPIVDGGVYAIVGPTGVGKTTTVAKLAARYALQHGPNSVALITTDNYRIAAHEQLKIYGRIIGCHVAVVNSSDELQNKLSELSSRRLILIDTAGMSQRDQRIVEQIERFNAVSTEIKKLLVLSATANRFTLEETIKVFSQYDLAGCIVTKLDEAVSLGEVMSLIIQKQLLLTYMTNGQRVPEDIQLGNSGQIVEQAIEMSQSYNNESDEWWTAKQLGEARA